MTAVLQPTTARRARMVFFSACAALLVAGLQVAGFFAQFEPRMTGAAEQLRALTVEATRRELNRAVFTEVEAIIDAAPAAEPGARSLEDAWSDFRDNFVAAPQQAVAMFRDELAILASGAGIEAEQVAQLEDRLAQLAGLYADNYRVIVTDLDEPPLYLWPTAAPLADWSGYRQAAVLNRALFLVQTGEIGTARVMLAGLNASADDPKVLGMIFYTLGRIQFELFRSTPEAEYYTQSLQYLRQSLVQDPDMELARRLLDFLLSLPLAATAPQAAEGRPEVPSEGQGAAVSAEKRIF